MTIQLPSAKQLAWLLVHDPAQGTTEEMANLKHVLQDTELSDDYSLVQQFVTMIRQRAVERLDL